MTPNRRPVAVVAAGMAVEGYDWVTFLTLLPYMTRELFGDDETGMTVGLAIFAAGFVSRPMGAYIVGSIADRRSRTTAFVASLWIGVGATTGMAFTPAIDGVAWAAPVLLLIFRVILGAAHGGQAAVVNAHMYEMHSVGGRLDPSALIYTMAACGKVVSLTVTLLTIALLGHEQMSVWGWRIPYVAGAVAGALLAIAATHGTDAARSRSEEVSTAPNLRGSAILARMAAVCALTVGTTLSYNIWVAGTVPYAVTHLGVRESTMVAISLGQTVGFAGLVVCAGVLMRHRPRTELYAASAVINAVFALPVLYLTRPSATLATYLVGTSLATVALAGLCAALPAVISALFPRSARGVGNGLPYAIAVALIGGTAPSLRETFSSNYTVFAWYAAATCLITAGTAIVVDHRSIGLRR
ncbi:MHS family alpha-ketoglutarate permease-like MFS transporter [Rhodococcus fascians]|uniref:MFS transporter n=1 Tax=Nocardiaceae TaxID=85025 RepID=UPI001D52E756|nr:MULTISPECIES: MFS transporter [Rhodococcus]MDJ0409204.1 MFS transporter [Rhodococcus fascians]MDR6910119.1 MHS family alpha-ketoglutarate permease-like MFS transporter [Rhodococcus sp. 3258]MDR6931235.1 MHS family alpha-ketoglutarate permease-like MFS transporter [Rhodococcus fascians]CAH0126097.1 Alpha-ketoglutarate permease [Rhodococcus fascians]